jgi:hypothetical protein
MYNEIVLKSISEHEIDSEVVLMLMTGKNPR